MKDNRHSVHAMMISVEICGLLGFDTCQSCGTYQCIPIPSYWWRYRERIRAYIRLKGSIVLMAILWVRVRVSGCCIIHLFLGCLFSWH